MSGRVRYEVVIPWMDIGCPHRRAAIDWVKEQWLREFPKWVLTVAELPPGPWCKARAAMPAIAASTADVVVVVDADVWSGMVAAAVEKVSAELGKPPRWAVPHRYVYRLGPDITADVLAGELDLPAGQAGLGERPRRGMVGGGMVVVERELALEVPLDARFVGYGGEDFSWGVALRTLGGRRYQGTAPLVHLHHPTQERMDRTYGSLEERALRLRYRAAVGDRSGDAMRALLDEPGCRLAPAR